ncbi:MAG TPA: hypothetical protein VFM58_08445 [Solirubrobacteraceae bacterium]|nr:hypothetical protein [Solirubrobacteraceae bacterium]
MVNPRINERRSPVAPAGEGRSLWRATLEAGAALLQDMTPLKDFDIYVVGLHCAKDEPGMPTTTAGRSTRTCSSACCSTATPRPRT